MLTSVQYVFGFFLDRARVFAAMQKAMSSFKEVDRTAAILKEDPKSIFQKVFVAKNLVAPTEGVLRGSHPSHTAQEIFVARESVCARDV